ncbi:MAG: Penicillin-binding protein 2 [Chlamydiae bacterium]|nr:Penicillin-binding protein 2 [Chlamydiota bacterium]
MNKNWHDLTRLTFLIAFVFCLFGLLFYRFFQIQVIEHEKWLHLAQNQYEKIEEVAFQRGVFYSNNLKGETTHTPLVVDVVKYHVFVDPKSIPDELKPTLCHQLCQLLNLEEETTQQEFYKQARARRIKAFIDIKEKHDVELFFARFSKKHKIPTNALFFTQDTKRQYPFGHLLGQVLHTVRDEKDPITKRAFPTGGLEMELNKVLQGSFGKQKHLVTPRRKINLGQEIQKVKNGAKVFLTINHHIQAICEKALKEGVIKAGAKGGWAIILDPQNGHVLALAQYPFFDPNEYTSYFNDESLLDHTRYRGITDLYEPASIMKPITCAIALLGNEILAKQNKSPLFDPEAKTPTTNPIFPGRTKPLKDVRLHYFLNMNMAIQKSSNIYMARLVEKIIATFGNEWYREALQLFGFGQKTHIELPSEQAGIVPKPGRLHPNGTLEWSRPTPYSLAMGHNLLASSMQMVTAFSALANGGYLVKPTLIKKITSEGEVLHEHVPKRIQILPKKIVDRVVEAIQYVTKIGGAARLANVYGYTEAGKTGSSEKVIHGTYSKDKHFSSFVGFSPAKNAKLCMIVTVDEPEVKFIPYLGRNQHGGICAAPIFREVVTQVFDYLGIEEDDPYGYPQNDIRYDFEKAHYVKKTKELAELYQQWNAR